MRIQVLDANGNQKLTATTVTTSWRVVTAAGAVTLLNSDYTVEINKIVGAPTVVYLLTSPLTGRQSRIVDGKGDAQINNITLTPPSGVTINGAATFVMRNNRMAVDIGYDGSEWKVV